MSGTKTYAVRNDCMEMQFTRKTEEGARRQLQMCAEAAPDVPCDLFEYRPNDGLWDWVATVVESAPLG